MELVGRYVYTYRQNTLKSGPLLDKISMLSYVEVNARYVSQRETSH